MSYESNWAATSDVVRTSYGTRPIDESKGGQVTTSGLTKELSWTFSYDGLPSAADGAMEAVIPKYAIVKNAYILVETAFVGGTSYNFGTYEADGTVIDADGIDAAVATSALNAVGKIVVCDGAQVGAVMAEAGQLVVAATGTYTAGKARVVIEYIDSNV